MFDNVKQIKENDPAAKSYIEILLCYPGLHALWFHSIAHFLFKLHVPILPRFINYLTRFLTGIDIHPGAKISSGIMIDHGMGVVIGETAEIAKGCLIYQGVTLGGTGKESGKRHPTLKENVVIGSGAKILGNIIIGKNVRIGAGSVVMRDVPDNCTVVGIPGKVVKSSPEMRDSMLEHGQMPDPVAKVFSILHEKIESLQRELADLSKDKIKTNLKKEDKEFLEEFFMDGEGI